MGRAELEQALQAEREQISNQKQKAQQHHAQLNSEKEDLKVQQKQSMVHCYFFFLFLL